MKKCEYCGYDGILYEIEMRCHHITLCRRCMEELIKEELIDDILSDMWDELMNFFEIKEVQG